MVAQGDAPRHLQIDHLVVGAESLSGPDAAEAWSRAIGRPVVYAADDLDAWAAQMREHMPPWLIDNLVRMYRYVGEHGMLATDDEIRATETLLGRPARRHASFVAETVAGLAA